MNGTLYEHVGLDKSTGWFKLWDTAVTQIAAAAQPDTVFALINGGFWIHTGRDKNSGWFKLWGAGVTDFSAGL